jgi:hypothetical protein
MAGVGEVGRFWCGDPEQDRASSSFPWWARQQSYETAFPEKYLSLSKMLIHRVPTKIPTK